MRSRITLPSGNPAGTYYVAVTPFNNDPRDAGGSVMSSPGDGPLASWGTDSDTGTYRIDFTGLSAAPPAAPVVSEVDYDQGATDDAEFVEVANAGGFAFDLGAYRLDLVNSAAPSTRASRSRRKTSSAGSTSSSAPTSPPSRTATPPCSPPPTCSWTQVPPPWRS